VPHQQDNHSGETLDNLVNHPGPAHIGGGSARVLQNFSITRCDALSKLAGIRPVADGPGQP